MEIKKTSDLSQFKRHKNNRAIDDQNLKKIIFSIKAKNLLEYRPILVDKDMFVIDGQHRLEAARSLAMDIYYQIKDESDAEDIVLLNANQKSWSRQDYIQYYVSKGNKTYVSLARFAKKNNMKEVEILHYLGQIDSIRAHSVRRGELEFPEGEAVEDLQRVVDQVKEILDTLHLLIIGDKRYLLAGKIKTALARLLNNPQVSFDVFMTKIKHKVDSVHPGASVQAYYAMFRDIYNWRNQNPIE